MVLDFLFSFIGNHKVLLLASYLNDFGLIL